jgi:hypothetical protein
MTSYVESHLFFEFDVTHGVWQLAEYLHSTDVGNVLNAPAVIYHLRLLKRYLLHSTF